MEKRTRVLLADANEEFRILLRQLLEETGEFEVAASTGDGPMVMELMRQAVHPEQEEPYHAPALEGMVTAIIHEIGVPAHIKGYQYLREAILLAVEDMDVINAVTKVLYPEVARRFSPHSQPGGAGHSPRH